MKIIIPNKLELLSCSVPEDTDDGSEWSEDTTYSKDDKVQKDHIAYSSLDDDNKGNIALIIIIIAFIVLT